MRQRILALGDRNIIGRRVTEARKAKGIKQKDLLAGIQTRGIDISASGLSKIEGQTRHVSDKELVALAQVLRKSVDWLLGIEG